MANIIPSPQIADFFYDNDGNPLAGGRLYSYKAGTNEPRDTYTDSTGLYVNTNPIILDDVGSCRIFISTNDDETGETADAYKFVMYDELGNLMWTVDNVYSLKGSKGTPGGPKGDRGDPGPQGIQGVQGPRGYAIKGDIGPKGDNGAESIFWRTAGIYTWTVPVGVERVDYIIGGGGGGWQLDLPLPNVGAVASGTAGQVKAGTINVNAGEVITIVIGEGGEVSTNVGAARGKNTTLASATLATITALGGSQGNTNIIGTSQYFQKMNPQLQFQLYNGKSFVISPQPVFGESTQFGEGGNIYKGMQAVAQGNCSSGGSSIPYNITQNQLGIATFGAGAPGICVFTYSVNND